MNGLNLKKILARLIKNHKIIFFPVLPASLNQLLHSFRKKVLFGVLHLPYFFD